MCKSERYNVDKTSQASFSGRVKEQSGLLK